MPAGTEALSLQRSFRFDNRLLLPAAGARSEVCMMLYSSRDRRPLVMQDVYSTHERFAPRLFALNAMDVESTPEPPIWRWVVGFLLVGVAWGFTTPFMRKAALHRSSMQSVTCLQIPRTQPVSILPFPRVQA
ncbi:hypothetical protein KC362_g70 [Hortaea werneckii]|nr:hypothetical protein KC362_g70 [Hortaea werneckii]